MSESCEVCGNYYNCRKVKIGECEDYAPALGTCSDCGILIAVGAEAYKFYGDFYCANCIRASLEDHRVDSYDRY